MRYTIEYVNQRGGAEQHSVIPMVFWDKQSALEGAGALMKTGVSVSKVEGPDFQMGRTALVAYFQSRRQRDQER
jgi:hypothetical protein